jgi:hypothetical protein
MLPKAYNMIYRPHPVHPTCCIAFPRVRSTDLTEVHGRQVPVETVVGISCRAL